jgi:CDP-diacylglycerol---serine O-phosphatidyltransferase
MNSKNTSHQTNEKKSSQRQTSEVNLANETLLDADKSEEDKSAEDKSAEDKSEEAISEKNSPICSSKKGHQGPVAQKPNNKGIYLLPNLFTTAGLFCGFYAIVASMNQQYEAAAIAIFLAMLMDALDGRAARMTNTQTAFGAQYDSLADMASFGLAPALIIYNWSLSTLGKFGWLACFIYVAGAALRLARFNTQVGIEEKKYFQGLASPAAAAILAGLVWVSVEYNIDNHSLSFVIAMLTLCMGLLMVSNFRYYSFKDFNLKGKVPFAALLVFVLLIVTIASEPAIVLFSLFFAYAISGPILTIWKIRANRILREKSTDK